MSATHVTRRIEFDAGHRITRHESKCAHPHGHRYVAEVTVAAPELDPAGRVVDFGVMKQILGAWIDEHWDHAFLICGADAAMGAVLEAEGWRRFVLPRDREPTAEHLAAYLYEVARRFLPDPVRVVRVRLYETPNCWAEHAWPDVGTSKGIAHEPRLGSEGDRMAAICPHPERRENPWQIGSSWCPVCAEVAGCG